MASMEQRDIWNDRYRDKGSVWGAAPNQFVARYLAGLSSQRVLDLGAGQGRNAIWLAGQGHDVTAVDISDVAMTQAQEIATAAGLDVDFIAADLRDWEPDPEAFDLVLLCYIQVPDSDRKAIHAKAARALKRGGRVFIVAHHRDNLEHGVGGPQAPDRLYDEATIADDFAGFRVEQNTTVARQVNIGETAGEALDLLFIAEKRPGLDNRTIPPPHSDDPGQA